MDDFGRTPPPPPETIWSKLDVNRHELFLGKPPRSVPELAKAANVIVCPHARSAPPLLVQDRELPFPVTVGLPGAASLDDPRPAGRGGDLGAGHRERVDHSSRYKQNWAPPARSSMPRMLSTAWWS